MHITWESMDYSLLERFTHHGAYFCICSVNSWQIVTKQSRSLTLNLQSKNGHRGLKNLGTLTVHAEETVASRKAVEMTFLCSHLENKDVFTKSVRTRKALCFRAFC